MRDFLRDRGESPPDPLTEDILFRFFDEELKAKRSILKWNVREASAKHCRKNTAGDTWTCGMRQGISDESLRLS
jgi:hypothetical protein